MAIDVTELQEHEVTLWDGSVTPLGRLWEEQPLVLVFLRHYG